MLTSSLTVLRSWEAAILWVYTPTHPGLSTNFSPDNDDVMYETMEVYPLSWVYYLTFIFFTAFAFLNMVIGIVVNVMERENEKARAEKAALLKAEKEAEGYREVTLELLMSELQTIKAKIDHKEK
jgi:voltage-gated sodium channel